MTTLLQVVTPTPQPAPHSGMETGDQLIPTLLELGDELNSDIMQTILNSEPANKAENGNLTWGDLGRVQEVAPPRIFMGRKNLTWGTLVGMTTRKYFVLYALLSN